MAEEKNIQRRGNCLRYEPENANAVMEDQMVMEDFSKVGCLRFCEKLQGCHTQVSKEFSLHFSVTTTKVGMINMPVTPEIIDDVTEIPRGQKYWFKGFRFDMEPCKEFMKLEFVDMDLNNAIPRSCIKDKYAKLLFNIKIYFTCEGRYHKVYTYHFKLLLHFTGIISLDLPFYLHRSLSKMADKVQAKSDGCETSLCHHGFIKLLVLNELQKINRDWSSFLFISGFEMEALTPARNPKTKGNPSPPVAESSQPVVTKAKRFVKLKPRKQVEYRTEKASVLVAKTPSPAKQKVEKVKETK